MWLGRYRGQGGCGSGNLGRVGLGMGQGEEGRPRPTPRSRNCPLSILVQCCLDVTMGGGGGGGEPLSVPGLEARPGGSHATMGSPCGLSPGRAQGAEGPPRRPPSEATLGTTQSSGGRCPELGLGAGQLGAQREQHRGLLPGPRVQLAFLGLDRFRSPASPAGQAWPGALRLRRWGCGSEGLGRAGVLQGLAGLLPCRRVPPPQSSGAGVGGGRGSLGPDGAFARGAGPAAPEEQPGGSALAPLQIRH